MHKVTGLFGSLWDHVPGHGLISGALHLVPGLAGGGTVASPGLSWVGENGPELLSLPRGAQVVPLDGAAKVDGLADRILVEVHIDPGNVNMDGKKVGNIVFKHYGVAVARA